VFTWESQIFSGDRVAQKLPLQFHRGDRLSIAFCKERIIREKILFMVAHRGSLFQAIRLKAPCIIKSEV
jgi:hypothetical protein